MMIEWIKFAFSALFMIVGLLAFICSVIGVNLPKFNFVLNRMHCASIADTLGIFCVILSLVIYRGISFDSLKLISIFAFMWLTSPVSSHLVAEIECLTNDELENKCNITDGKDVK